MTTRIIYDTEFIDDGVGITPLSIAMIRESDGMELYAVTDSLAAIARAAESAWLRDNVLRWLPVDVTLSADYGKIDAKVEWNEDHPGMAYVAPIETIAEMVEDFVLAKPDPQLWAYYGAYDHVLYAQLFGPMAELADGMPMYTMDLKQYAVMLGDPKLPELPDTEVQARFGQRMEHHALYDAYEEAYRLEWLDEYRRKHVS